MVVSDMGEQWSPNRPPDRIAGQDRANRNIKWYAECMRHQDNRPKDISHGQGHAERVAVHLRERESQRRQGSEQGYEYNHNRKDSFPSALLCLQPDCV